MSQPLGLSTPLAPPLYQSSVYTLRDLDELDQILNGEEPGFIYARDAHPNARQLADALGELEGAEWSLICGSGMAAISAGLLALLRGGDRIVASNRLYGRTAQLFQDLERFGITTELIDATDLDEVRTALRSKATVLFVESLSNPLLRLVDIEELTDLAHAAGAVLVVDNTFLTPVLLKPMALGADLVIESVTKMIGGHSDVTLGLVCGLGQLLPQVTQASSVWGLAANPFDCWLALRGLETLALRMKTASTNAAALADWLADQEGVNRVVYPGRDDHPDFELAQRLLPDGFGNMLAFELDGGRSGVNRFLRAAPGIPFSPSLGHTTTTCSHPGTTSHRYISAAEKKRQGISDGLIRLSVGIEDLDTIKNELTQGLS
jgi:cystathionine beta-lyase/cystathionine gamma-synthase